MAKDPSMPFYVNDWLSSGRVLCMTLEQQGAYVRLLCHCWASQDASLPDDEQALAVLSGIGEGWLNNGCPLVRANFVKHPLLDGCLTNQKLYELWQERLEWRKKSIKGGKKSAAKRKLQKKLQQSKGGSTTVDEMVDDCLQPNGNSSSSSSSSSFNSPPPPLGAPSKATITPQWKEEEEELFSRGITKAADAIIAVIANGCPIGMVRRVVTHFDQQQPAWSAGALYQRLLALRPDQDITSLWPEPAKQVQQQQRSDKQQAASADYRKEKAEQAERIQAERAADEARVAELENSFGDAIDMLDSQGLTDLIKQAEPTSHEFHVRRYRKSGLTASLRILLLEHLAGGVQSMPENQSPENQPTEASP